VCGWFGLHLVANSVCVCVYRLCTRQDWHIIFSIFFSTAVIVCARQHSLSLPPHSPSHRGCMQPLSHLEAHCSRERERERGGGARSLGTRAMDCNVRECTERGAFCDQRTLHAGACEHKPAEWKEPAHRIDRGRRTITESVTFTPTPRLNALWQRSRAHALSHHRIVCVSRSEAGRKHEAPADATRR
jgi:hypothetical protein